MPDRFWGFSPSRLKNRKKGTENHRHYHCKYDQHDHDGRENLSCFFVIHVKQTIHLFLLSIPVTAHALSKLYQILPMFRIPEQKVLAAICWNSFRTIFTNIHFLRVPENYPCFFAFSGILPYWKIILSISSRTSAAVL